MPKIWSPESARNFVCGAIFEGLVDHVGESLSKHDGELVAKRLPGS
jgi:hypothetical protein